MTKPIVFVLQNAGPLTPAQLTRVLRGAGFPSDYDPAGDLAEMTEAGCLEQNLSRLGVVYVPTDAGQRLLASDDLYSDDHTRLRAACEEYAKAFEREKDFLAQYTEGATGICHVFLSIREKERIKLQISVNVNDVATAKKITEEWVGNASEAYDAVWAKIAAGLPKPTF